MCARVCLCVCARVRANLSAYISINNSVCNYVLSSDKFTLNFPATIYPTWIIPTYRESYELIFFSSMEEILENGSQVLNKCLVRFTTKIMGPCHFCFRRLLVVELIDHRHISLCVTFVVYFFQGYCSSLSNLWNCGHRIVSRFSLLHFSAQRINDEYLFFHVSAGNFYLFSFSWLA